MELGVGETLMVAEALERMVTISDSGSWHKATWVRGPSFLK
jgi:hypothetical protein